MKRVYDLADLDWTLSGHTPYLWRFERLFFPEGAAPTLDVGPIPARVPGAVQAALRQAGILPDWNIGRNARQCEWVEHRHWIYRARIPDAWLDARAAFRLECLGLDYSGWIYVNGREVATFKGTHLPHVFDITPHLRDADNRLEIVFDLPPRWLGQFGYTSQMKEWKTRFNYTWDWVPRLVQTGIWDAVSLIAVEGSEIGELRCTTDADLRKNTGILEIGGTVAAGEADRVEVSLVRVVQQVIPGACDQEPSRVDPAVNSEAIDATTALESSAAPVRRAEFSVAEFARGLRWDDLPVELWWPNLEGEQPLYTLTCRLLDAQGGECDRQTRRLGFRHVEWRPCQGAPPQADPWVCAVNGRPVFLQGVNFAPIRALYADLTREDYEKRLALYRELGGNLLRINACQFLEKPWFYDLCDALGLMVWQDFPLTSSGIDNWPPEDETSIAEMAAIARSFIRRRQHHASLILWSGGNELQGDLEGRKTGMGKPCGAEHPMLARLEAEVRELDPGRRYIPTSPSGPRAGASPAESGKGLHWDVHGGAAMGGIEDAQKYWEADDALFRSEIYCSGASPVELIHRYAGEFAPFPPTAENPYWTFPTAWWLDWQKLIAAHGREPRDLAEYVDWSQAHQARMLALEMKACKDRFPGCGGVLLWSGHDTSPLPINTSIIDFEGNPKPAAFALAQVWRGPAGKDREQRP